MSLYCSACRLSDDPTMVRLCGYHSYTDWMFSLIKTLATWRAHHDGLVYGDKLLTDYLQEAAAIVAEQANLKAVQEQEETYDKTESGRNG